ncbi:MAG: hypothetical protein ACE5Q6_18995, partial [Dehalococcoidia bacterium]
MSYQRLAGIGGIIFVGLVVAVNVMLGASSSPWNDASVQEVAFYFQNNQSLVTLVVSIAPVIW